MLLHFLSWPFTPRIYLWILYKISFTILIIIVRAIAGELQHSLPVKYGGLGRVAISVNFFDPSNNLPWPYIKDVVVVLWSHRLNPNVFHCTHETFFSVLLAFLLNTAFYICGIYLFYDTTFSLNKTSCYNFQCLKTGEYVHLSTICRIPLNGHWDSRYKGWWKIQIDK